MGNENKKISKGALVGIIVQCVCLVLVIVALVLNLSVLFDYLNAEQTGETIGASIGLVIVWALAIVVTVGINAISLVTYFLTVRKCAGKIKIVSTLLCILTVILSVVVGFVPIYVK